MAVTIQHLEVRFDVDAGEQDQEFVRLFQKYITQWSRIHTEEQIASAESEASRALGDREEEA